MEEVTEEKEEKCQLENILVVEHMKCPYMIDWCLCVLLLNTRMKTNNLKLFLL